MVQPYQQQACRTGRVAAHIYTYTVKASQNSARRRHHKPKQTGGRAANRAPGCRRRPPYTAARRTRAAPASPPCSSGVAQAELSRAASTGRRGRLCARRGAERGARQRKTSLDRRIQNERAPPDRPAGFTSCSLPSSSECRDSAPPPPASTVSTAG